MTYESQAERRTGLKDRRVAPFNRRQFISISWPLNQDRRLTRQDRRQGLADRRESSSPQTVG